MMHRLFARLVLVLALLPALAGFMQVNQLVGFGVVESEQASSVSFTFQTSSTATGSSHNGVVSLPSGSAAGDLVIAFVWGGGFGNRNISAPSGWTTISTVSFDNGNDVEVLWCYKVLTSGDVSAGSVDFAASAIDYFSAVMLRFEPSAAIATITPQGQTAQNITGNPTAQTQNANASGADTVLVFGGVSRYGAGSVVFNASTSPAFDGQVAASDNRAGYAIYNPGDSKSSHTIDADAIGNDTQLTSFYLEIT